MSPNEPASRPTPERWREVEAMFLATRDQESDERAAFLERACGADVALRHEVESLLAADRGATGFLEPLGGTVSPMPDLETAVRVGLAGRYALERELGRGGMATVYLADDLKHPRRVAIKVLDPELGAVLGAERFLREIRIAARLSHPHILPLHDRGRSTWAWAGPCSSMSCPMSQASHCGSGCARNCNCRWKRPSASPASRRRT